jgi:hypothetical protein
VPSSGSLVENRSGLILVRISPRCLRFQIFVEDFDLIVIPYGEDAAVDVFWFSMMPNQTSTGTNQPRGRRELDGIPSPARPCCVKPNCRVPAIERPEVGPPQ